MLGAGSLNCRCALGCPRHPAGGRLHVQPSKPYAPPPLGPPFRACECFQLGRRGWPEELLFSVFGVYWGCPCSLLAFIALLRFLSSPLSPWRGVCGALLPSEKPRSPRAGAGFPGVLTTGYNLGLSGLAVPLGPLEEVFPPGSSSSLGSE